MKLGTIVTGQLFNPRIVVILQLLLLLDSHQFELTLALILFDKLKIHWGVLEVKVIVGTGLGLISAIMLIVIVMLVLLLSKWIAIVIKALRMHHRLNIFLDHR